MSSQIERIKKVLGSKSNKTGFSAGTIAQKTGLSRVAVYRRLSDIRSEGYKIVTTSRVGNGRRKKFYRFG